MEGRVEGELRAMAHVTRQEDIGHAREYRALREAHEEIAVL